MITIRRLADRAELGLTAAADIARFLRDRLARQENVRVIFAAADSQKTTLAALILEPDIDWRRVTAFHMDEYIGLPPEAPQRFGNWLRRHFFDHLPIGAVHLMAPERGLELGLASYTKLLREAPIDAVCLGIGVNGHLAFNDPPFADLADPLDVKEVGLDPVSLQQQVDEGAFAAVELMPRTAITLTVPRLLRADRLFCMVPGAAKREAVRRSLRGPISDDCPGSALRNHPACILYLDKESAADVH